MACTLLHEIPMHAQVLLQYMGQVMRALLSSATDATARGVAAAGVEVGLPEEVWPCYRRKGLRFA